MAWSHTLKYYNQNAVVMTYASQEHGTVEPKTQSTLTYVSIVTVLMLNILSILDNPLIDW